MNDAHHVKTTMHLTSKQMLKSGATAHNSGNLKQASQYYSTILKSNPAHPYANYRMGLLALKFGDKELALRFLARAVQANPNLSIFRKQLVEVLIALGRLQQAKRELVKGVKNEMSITEFKRLYSEIEKLNVPDFDEPEKWQLEKITKLHESNEHQTALDVTNELLKKSPKSVTLLNIKGTLQQNLGYLAESEITYRTAISLSTEAAELYNNLGNTQRMMGKLNEAAVSFQTALKIRPTYPQAHNNLGNVLKSQGRLELSIDCYQNAILYKSDYAEAYSNLATVFKDLGMQQKAIDAYKRALEIKPSHGNALHMLSILTEKQKSAVPKDYIETLFDSYAANFDKSLTFDLDYYLPKLIVKRILETHYESELGEVLDLGCGTGLLGPEISKYCSRLEGIDLSNLMLGKAREKKVYARLTQSEISEYLNEAEIDFDYFIAADVFIYVGDLERIFRAIKSKNKKAGKLVFSTEHTNEGSFNLQSSGRFAHSKTYISKLCAKLGYQINHFEKFNLRKENKNYIEGALYILSF